MTELEIDRSAAMSGGPHGTGHRVSELAELLDYREAGGRMSRLIAELYPICRSITGDGVRETLRRLQENIPLDIHEVATGIEYSIGRFPRNGTSAMPG